MSEKNENHAKNYHELSGAEGLAKVENLIAGIHICMMTTVGKDGSMDSRPMGVPSGEKGKFDGTIWFLTRATSEKVTEVENDQHMTLTFAEPKDSKYVTLKGRASISGDRGKIKELWSPIYKAWFPKGEEDPDIAVMRVEITGADYWEASASKLVVMAKYVAAAVTGGSVAVGESGHVSV